MKQCNYDPAVKSAYAQARKHLIFRLGDKQTSMQKFALTLFKTLTSTISTKLPSFQVFHRTLIDHEHPLQDKSIARSKNTPFSSSAMDLSYINSVQQPHRRKISRNATKNASIPHRGLRPSQATSPPASLTPTANRFPHDTVSGRSARCLCRAVLRCRAR